MGTEIRQNKVREHKTEKFKVLIIIITIKNIRIYIKILVTRKMLNIVAASDEHECNKVVRHRANCFESTRPPKN